MIIPPSARKRIIPCIVSRSRSIFSSSLSTMSSSLSTSSSTTIYQPDVEIGVASAASRLYSQQSNYYNHNATTSTNNYFGLMASVVAATSLIATSSSSSSSSQTLCEGSSSNDVDENGDPEELPTKEPEVDPYDNLPEQDEATHCSICLTYRQGPCRPYWRKVEACTKDGENENKKKEGGGGDDDDGDDDDNKNNDNENNPMSESTRCFKYMMPWIDCASKYRNLYTLIEMDTNYMEGIQDLEATSLHFCWLSGKEPKIDWTNWGLEQTRDVENKNEKSATETATAETTPNDTDTDTATDIDIDIDTDTNIALWKTLDPALGDAKLITVEAQVPATINEGLGILECAYAVDQDNNVIGFAYGTKPSDLIDNENEKDSDDANADADAAGDKQKSAEGSDDDEKKKGATEDDDATAVVTNDEEEEKIKMIPLNIRIVASRTKEFVLAASYTHTVLGGVAVDVVPGKEEKKSDGNKDEEKKNSTSTPTSSTKLESHLYKSRSFRLKDVPKWTPPPPPQENDVGGGGTAPVDADADADTSVSK